ncbi:MAG: WD40 repeat domain-containing protein, partial [Desulfobacterales bacterium]
MAEEQSWDWETGEKRIPFAEWKENFRWVEEPYTSPDGEKIAAIVNIDEGEFSVCVNGETWEAVFDKIWHLRFTSTGRPTAIVSEMGEWTMADDGTAWENKFGYIWNPIYSADGRRIAVAFQQDMQYGMALNDTPWKETYSNITYFA